MTREEEREIIESVRSGETEAFGALVAEHQNRVFSLALRMVGNEEDARDLAQEAFIRAYTSLAGFRGDSKFSVWLYRLTSNICIDFLRSRARRQAVSLTYDDDEAEGGEMEIPDERFSPEAGLERSELREAVRRGLDTLSPEFRDILLLREIDGLSYAEIGEALQLEEGTVKSRIFRARKKLTEFLSRDGNLPGCAASQGRKGGVDT